MDDNYYNYPTALTTAEQHQLYYQYLETKDDNYKAKIAISYTACIHTIFNSLTINRSGEHLDKEDIIADLLMIVYNSIDKFDISKASIYTYIYRVIYSKCIDKLRYNNVRLKRRSYCCLDDILSDEPNDSPKVSSLEKLNKIDETYYKIDKCGYQDIYGNDNIYRINEVLEQLSKDEKQLIMFRYIYNRTISEIMNTMNINRSEFGNIEKSALEKLRDNQILQEIINDR